MKELRELLVKWAETEPDRCRLVYSGAEVETVEVLQPDDQFWCTVTVTEERSLLDRGEFKSYIQILLQGLVQGAIEKHRWHYEQRWYGTDKVALVYPHKVTEPIRYEADSFAEALLAAYIEVLEVVREQALPHAVNSSVETSIEGSAPIASSGGAV